MSNRLFGQLDLVDHLMGVSNVLVDISLFIIIDNNHIVVLLLLFLIVVTNTDGISSLILVLFVTVFGSIVVRSH